MHTTVDGPPDNLLDAARFYRERHGWAVHPLHGPNEGSERERGKKPKLAGYNKPDYQGLDTDAALVAAFGNGKGSNLGIVVRPPHVVVDLDSKKDAGESVRAWLAERPELAEVPRERTAGGAHLHFICRDAPKLDGGKQVEQLNEFVTAEIFTGPSNMVVSPSVHPTGQRYAWEVFREVFPEVRWQFLMETFKAPVQARSKGRGDVTTLDIVALTKDLGIYGKRIGGEEPKHAIKCPWHDEHSTKGDFSDTSTTVWEPEPHGKYQKGGFHCLHGHCAGRQLKHFLAWADGERPGIVNTHCEKMLPEQLGGAFDADLIERYGDDFMRNAEGRVTGIGEAYWAGLYATENVMLWEPEEQKFYLYDAGTGLYLSTTRDGIKRDLSDLLLREGRSRGVRGMERWRGDSSLNHLVAQLRGITEQRGAFADRPPAVHLANGVIDFS